MIQWGRADGYVTLVDIVGQLVRELLCRTGHHVPVVEHFPAGGNWMLRRRCDRCGKPL